MSMLAAGESTRQSLCAARSKVDSILAEPKIQQTVLIRPQPRFLREAMVQLREARQRLGDPAVGHRPLRDLDPIAEVILQETTTIDLRDEASRADRTLRLARLARRAAAVLDQIAIERAASDAQVTLPPAPAGNDTSPLIPAQQWDAIATPPAVEAPGDRPELDERWLAATHAEVIATIRLLGQLRDEGLVTETEFQTKKEQLLARL
jgi:hypothetical protein